MVLERMVTLQGQGRHYRLAQLCNTLQLYFTCRNDPVALARSRANVYRVLERMIERLTLLNAVDRHVNFAKLA